MVKFLHTADWHIGMKHVRMGGCAERLRDVRYETLQRVLQKAQDENVDFIIIAGDLFDSNDISKKRIEFCTQIIAEVSPLQVYILPGNHDPLTRDSVYFHSAWSNIQNVTIFKEPTPLRIDKFNLTLYPCPVTQKQSLINPTEWIPTISDDSISVAIAHGNLNIHSASNANFPISTEIAMKKNLDYVALGEWHSTLYEGLKKIAYSGTPETTKFDEENSGNVLIVEINTHNSLPVIREVHVGSMQWNTIKKQIYGSEDISALTSELNSIKDKDKALARANLEGISDYDVYEEIMLLEEKYKNEFFFFETDTEKLTIKPDITKILTLMPDNAIYKNTVYSILALMKKDLELRKYTEEIDDEQAKRILHEIENLQSVANIKSEQLEHALMLLYKTAKDIVQDDIR